MMDAVELYWRRFCYVTEHYARQLPRGRGYLRVDAPLTRDVVHAHLAGDLTLSLYLLDANDRCAFGILDHDNYRTWTDAQGKVHHAPEDGLRLLQGVRERLAQHGIEAALETSRRGAHLWVFAAEPVPAREMRALLHWAADGHNLEMYPKQDHRGTGVGSNIRAPLGVHQASGERYPFVGENGRPVAHTMGGQIAYLAQVHDVDVARTVDRLGLRSLTERDAGVDQVSSNVQFMPTHYLSLSHPWQRSAIKTWIDAVRCEDIVGAYIPLDARGVGHCPWPEHHKNGDRHASFQVLTRANRWRCWATNETGNAFDFVCKMENLDPKEALAYCQRRWPIPELERERAGRG